MNLELIRDKVFTYTKLRLKKVPRDVIANDIRINFDPDETILCYSGQSDAYYFDHNYKCTINNKEIGIEGAFSVDFFKCSLYTEIDSKAFSLKISDLPSVLGEDEFFQLSLVEDLNNMTVHQLNSILEIRDILLGNKIEWGIK